MTFTPITKIEFNRFIKNHPQRTFMQSVEIGNLRKINGYDVYYLGVKENNVVVAACMLTSIKTRFGLRQFYSPRGLLVDYYNKELLSFFVKNLKKFIKDKKGYILRIDPYVIYKQRDINGKIIDGGTNNEKVIENLYDLGFKKRKEEDFEQVSWMFALDTKNKTIDEVFKSFKPNTRNTIRKLENQSISVRKLEYDELNIFLDVIESTGKRKSFKNRKLSYYQNMYKLFKDDIVFLVTEIDFVKYIEELKTKLNEKENELNSLNGKNYNNGKKESILKEKNSILKKINEAEAEEERLNDKDKVVLSAGMFILKKPEVIYLTSGNYEKYLKYKSMYLIQWEMIKYAISNSFDRYNFYGIPANIESHPKNYEIYEFKKGFNGYVEELIGEFSLPINIFYYIIELVRKL